MNQAIFLDRDGVINEAIVVDGKPYPPNNLERMLISVGIRELLAVAMKMGYYIFIFTNQPDVATGKQKIEEVERIHDFLLDNLPIDKIYACFHSDADNCLCRKPKIGLLLEAQKEYDIDLSKSWVIGDRWKDIDAGYSAGCKTIFLDKGYKEQQSFNMDFTIKNIEEVMEIINANQDIRRRCKLKKYFRIK